MKFINHLLIIFCIIQANSSAGQELSMRHAKKLDAVFYKNINNLHVEQKLSDKLIRSQSHLTIELYTDSCKENDENSCHRTGILRIEDYYITIKIGFDPLFEVKDIAGNSNEKELVLYTGSFYDVGNAGQKYLIIRYFADAPFTVTEFTIDDDGGFYTGANDYRGAVSSVLTKTVKKNGGFIYIFSKMMPNSNGCWLIYQAIYPSKRGFKMGVPLLKRKRRFCAA